MHHGHTIRTLMLDILYDIAGSFLFALAVQCFSAPNSLAPGGVSGVSILVNYLTGLPISMLSFALNIPLLWLAWRFLGKALTLNTLKSVAILSIMLEICSSFPEYHGNIILVALYTGVLQGVGLALVFMRGSTTGGTDIVSRLIQRKFPYFPVGQVMVGIDILVLAASVLVYGRVENALVALVALFIHGRVLDGVLYGLDMGKVMLIISEEYSRIAAQIHHELERGCTVLDGRGSYTASERPVLLCAVRKQQLYLLKKLVREIDPAAFMLAFDATEVIGNGFQTE